MLTDCPSQFEMKGVNNIPKSFQKLINEIQNVKQNKKQSKSKSTSLDVKTVSKNTKNPTTVKKKRKPKQSKPVETALEENDESNVPENFVQIPNQTNITEFFNTARSNSSNRRTNKNPEKARKQEVPNIDVDILSSDSDDFLYSNQNPRPTTDFKEQDFSVSEFQNPDYLSFLSDRNQSFNPINEADRFGNATESNLKGKKLHCDQTKDTNWKTFNEMNDDMDCDFIIERKKNIAPNIFYSHNKTNEKIPSRIGKNITNKSGSSIKKNSDSDVIRQQNVSNDAAKKLMNLLRDDREKMTTLLNQVKSMSDSVTKARQGISKFFVNRNN
ncbi:uncharacterized protein LOC135831708 [Planococcus citri]|uniref:uncharacterized protein LOC135831708 n=1 Tax=Planococcus citri TaxID=170843 RepID=UPI0031F9C13A